MVELFLGLMLAVVLIPVAMCCIGLWLGMQRKKQHHAPREKQHMHMSNQASN